MPAEEYSISYKYVDSLGTDINVPPPTTDDQNYAAIRPLAPGEEDDGQYREDPSIYWKDERFNRPAAPTVAKQTPAARPQYYQPQYEEPQQAQYEEQPQQYQAPQHRFQYSQQTQSQQQQPRAYYQTQAFHQPQPQQQQRHQPQPGYDVNTGSYTVSFTG